MERGLENMKLQNPFPEKVRLLYMDYWACFLCGFNGWNRGGLEIHHILGRVSDSAFNSSCLCGYCHKRIGHTKEEHQKIFYQTVQFLKKILFKPEKEDLDFLRENYSELVCEKTEKWIKYSV